jgi:hypothetical protein
MKRNRVLILAALVVLGAAGMTGVAAGDPFHFVPNSFEFWDFSKNWTTNYGPAYRDTVEDVTTNFLACTGQFALCFHSGAKPLPCKLTKDGRFANCTCTVMDGANFVLITAILNRQVYDKTVKACHADGSDCPDPDDAPVCKFLDKGKLIPGAQLISTFDPSSIPRVWLFSRSRYLYSIRKIARNTVLSFAMSFSIHRSVLKTSSSILKSITPT